MKLVISVVLSLLLITAHAYSDIYNEVLKNSIEGSGYILPEDINPKVDPELAAIGMELFNSEKLSFNSKISCQSCHLDERSSTDGLPNAVGVGGIGKGVERINSNGLIVPRNVLPLWGRGIKDFNTFFWDGKVQKVDNEIISQFLDQVPSDDPLVVAAHLPLVEIREMIMDNEDISQKYKNENVENANNLYKEIIAKLSHEPELKKLSDYYNITPEEITALNIGEALAEHIRDHFSVRETKFSLYVKDKIKFTKAELNGGLIFYGKGRCASCHSGPLFSDMKFHVVGFPHVGFGKNGFGIDYGRFNVTDKASDLYKFRTPPLIEVANTGPYGHSGSLSSLKKAIIAHFDPLSLVDTKNMKPLDRVTFFNRLQKMNSEIEIPYLNDDEIDEIEAFLKTLSFNK